jgi:hypothetical protein
LGNYRVKQLLVLGPFLVYFHFRVYQYGMDALLYYCACPPHPVPEAPSPGVEDAALRALSFNRSQPTTVAAGIPTDELSIRHPHRLDSGFRVGHNIQRKFDYQSYQHRFHGDEKQV